jgi:hypothetical protein
MSVAELSREEFAALAKEIYYRDIRPLVIDGHHGEFLVLDVESGDYEVDKDSLQAGLRMREKRPNGRRFLFRIGYQAAYSFGGMMKPDEL